MKNTICLFDMDGTLTEPRKDIKQNMIAALRKLSDHATIGIVTGSDFDYVMQQCSALFDVGGVPTDRIEIFPCNGTKHYTWKNNCHEIVHDVNMIAEIGQKNYNYMVQTLLSYQLMLSVKHDLPYTGTFLHYRGSMLNWCPVGRQAGDVERKAWVDEDTEHKIREAFLRRIDTAIAENKISLTAALGGSTSFDIYPTGWDKTYVMNHLNAYDKIYFVGDRCQEGGNDKALYDLLQIDNASFETEGPEQSISIIENLIKGLNQ
jgi:phosphomannomutase